MTDEEREVLTRRLETIAAQALAGLIRLPPVGIEACKLMTALLMIEELARLDGAEVPAAVAKHIAEGFPLIMGIPLADVSVH